MKAFLETTVWNVPAVNHIYLLSDDKSKMYAYVRSDTKELKQFKSPIGIDTRGRKFQLVENTYGFDIPEIASEHPNWKVVGSKGDVYNVELVRGSYRCSCPGFKFRHKCGHIDKVAK
jgi:hypothetical protein